MGLSIALAYLIEPLAELAVDDTGNLLVPSDASNCGFHTGSTGPAYDKEVVCGTKCGLDTRTQSAYAAPNSALRWFIA